MPLFLSANAPKQKIFAIDSSSSLPIRFGPNVPPYAWPGLTGNLIIIGNARGICWAAGCVGAVGMVGTGCKMALGCLGRVLFIPCLGRFICSLAVPGPAFRYFVMSFFGHIRAPFEETLPRCLQQCGNLWITQGLMCKFNCLGSRMH
jgi:hypothetical protein